jgi:hypothetical protein
MNKIRSCLQKDKSKSFNSISKNIMGTHDLWSLRFYYLTNFEAVRSLNVYTAVLKTAPSCWNKYRATVETKEEREKRSACWVWVTGVEPTVRLSCGCVCRLAGTESQVPPLGSGVGTMRRGRRRRGGLQLVYGSYTFIGDNAPGSDSWKRGVTAFKARGSGRRKRGVTASGTYDAFVDREGGGEDNLITVHG